MSLFSTCVWTPSLWRWECLSFQSRGCIVFRYVEKSVCLPYEWGMLGAGVGSFQTQRLWLQRRIVLSDNVLIMSDNAWFTSENAFSCVIINEFMYYLCTGNERLRPRNALLMSDNAFSLKIMYEFIYLMCKATCEIYRQFSKLARTQGKSSKIIRKLCFFVKRRKGYQTIQLGGGGSGWDTIPLGWIIHQVASYIYIYI